jgi:hypothetical protein
MKKLMMTVFPILFFASMVNAQDYSKVEVFAGYSLMHSATLNLQAYPTRICTAIMFLIILQIINMYYVI